MTEQGYRVSYKDPRVFKDNPRKQGIMRNGDPRKQGVLKRVFSKITKKSSGNLLTVRSGSCRRSSDGNKHQ